MDNILKWLLWGFFLFLLAFICFGEHKTADALKAKFKKRYKDYKDSNRVHVNHQKQRAIVEGKINRCYRQIIIAINLVYILVFVLVYQNDLSFDNFVYYVGASGIMYSIASFVIYKELLSPNELLGKIKSFITTYYNRKESFNPELSNIYIKKRDNSRVEVLEILKLMREQKYK